MEQRERGEIRDVQLSWADPHRGEKQSRSVLCQTEDSERKAKSRTEIDWVMVQEATAQTHTLAICATEPEANRPLQLLWGKRQYAPDKKILSKNSFACLQMDK